MITTGALVGVIERIVTELGITLKHPWHIDTWQIRPTDKIMIPGTQTRNGQAVAIRLKIRNPLGPVSKEKFVGSEQVAEQVNEALAAAGLPAQRTLETQFNSSPEWILRLDLPGTPTGDHAFSADINFTELTAFLAKWRPALDAVGQRIDRQLLAQPDWAAKWFAEFRLRRPAVAKQVGEQAAATLEQILSQPFRAELTNSLVHTDLAPPNILRGPDGFFVIDWNEAAWGPKALDWMMVWSFLLDSPTVRQAILKLMIGECRTTAELAETKTAARMIAARMVASFAEWADYHTTAAAAETQFAAEAAAALPKAWRNFQELETILND